MGRALAEPSETSEEIVSAPSGLPYEFEQPAPPMTGVEEPVEPIRVAEGGPSADPKRVRAEDLLEEGPSFARGEEEEFTLPRTEVDEKPVIEPYSEPSPARLPKESAEPPTLDMDTLIPAAPGESVEEEAPLLVKSAEDGEEVGMTPKRAVDRPGGKPVGIPVTKPISRAYVRIFDEDGQPVTDSATVIDIEPVTSSRLEYNGSSYNGTFQAYAPSDEWLVLVNNADLEDYVAGILPQEIPAEAPFEVLKAQAVVSRCYALQLAQSGEYTEYGYDILGDADSDWPYTGSKKETPSIRNAVEETAGEVLIDSNGGLATPVYCFSSGGYVADALSVWGNSGEPVPEYLKARPDFDPATVGVAISPEGLADDEGLLEEWLSSPPNTFDSEAAGEHFRWKKTLTEDQMDALVNDFWNDQVGHVKSISIIRRAKSGHASEMKIEGELQTVEARDSDTIREALQLDSSLILIKEGWGSGWSVYGGGLGHGVGMSQCGAIGLVKQKKANYKQVLHFYFDELKLGRRQISRSPEGA
jgi:SpoIID/LytB domain protein